MTGRTRLIAAVAGVVIGLVLFFFLFIRPRRTELREVRAEVEAAEQQTNVLQNELRHLRQLQADAPGLQAKLTRIRRYVPETADVTNFLFQVQEASDEAGVRFTQVQFELPKPPPEGAPVAEVRVTINARGGYFSIQDFFRRLYALKRALRIDNVQMTGQTEGGGEVTTINLQIAARIFFELPPTTPATVPGAASTAPPPPTPTPGTGG